MHEESIISKVKRKIPNWEIIFATDITNELISLVYKPLLTIKKRKTKIPIEKWDKEKAHRKRKANNHDTYEKNLHFSIVKEMQIKTTLR